MKWWTMGTWVACLAVSRGALERDIRAELGRADDFGRKAAGLVKHTGVRPYWHAGRDRMVYRIDTGAGTHAYRSVDFMSGRVEAAFDHERVAVELTKHAGRVLAADALPIDEARAAAGDGGLLLRALGRGWRLDPATGALIEAEFAHSEVPLLAPGEVMRRPRGGGQAAELTVENVTPGEIELLWVEGRGQRRSYGRLAAGGRRVLSTYAGHGWVFADARGGLLAGIIAGEGSSLARVVGAVQEARVVSQDRSPDGKWRALIRDGQLVVEPAGGGAARVVIRPAGSSERLRGPFHWSPDSTKLVAYRESVVEVRRIPIVSTMPKDRLQPKLLEIPYPKPGDPLVKPRPCLIDVAGAREIEVSSALFDNPWELSDGGWGGDSGEFTFVYNQRGHQCMRVLGVRGDTGSVRVILEETSRTFIDYSQKYFFRRIEGGKSFLWASERDGFNHLYRFDSASGRLLNAVTSGSWNVREVVEVDEEKRHLLLKVVGLAGSDPYHVHWMRVGFDGGDFVRLTEGDGSHQVRFSPCGSWLLDTWSRIDQPPVTELRRVADGALIARLGEADDSALRGEGWSRPERFVAPGRDGKTPIHGIIVRPRNFDPKRRYPVLEDIYAGPHDHFVPKTFLSWSGMHAMAELGFVVVKIDGMGTNWRSKAFHDVCWKNLADSGFPDRIAWIRAAAAGRPWMDLKRVGVYGGSAGGQSTLSGMLHHPDFYRVGVADCGCHDNRMDKTWWNEAWMGWPVDESYARNSNVTHAAKLRGRLMLIVGELDQNVDPASTYQVVGALQQAGCEFDFVPVIGAGHGAAETPYGRFRRAAFLVRHLQGT